MYTIATVHILRGTLTRVHTPSRTDAIAAFSRVRRTPSTITRLWYNGQLVA